ncbi:MAG: bifunctional aspartate kinase/homoserine dehydrogenase I [Ferruginibacter sp.]|nr:bifunctional aspartate kinase/homoserine dehydrogenase I [Ferruginibacter sp.]
MQILKFGGSSVENAVNISRVADIITNSHKKGRTAVVVSAMGAVTDTLLKIATLASLSDESYKSLLVELEKRHLDVVKTVIPVNMQSNLLSQVKKICNDISDICNGIFLIGELSERTKDRIISYGEIMSSKILSAKLQSMSVENEWKDSRDLITTDANFGKAAVDFPVTNNKITAFFLASESSLFILPGFIASSSNGDITTLGRGGSDYTGAILAAACNATVFEVWTDVSGMMTADPRIVKNIKLIPRISYQEAMELSHFGAKVIYPPTIQPVMNKNIPVWIKNTFAPEDPGTIIHNEENKTGNAVCGISSISKIVLISLEGSGMVGIPGFSKRLFEALANAQINVILITQSSSEHSICVGIEEAFIQKAKNTVDNTFTYEIETGKLLPLIVEKDLSIVALVGDNMKNHSGISGKMFSALGRNGVNIRAIAQGSSERNISVVIATADVKKSINVLHEDFFETTYKQLNLFIAGAGNVGKRLLSQILQQQLYLQQHLSLNIQVVGMANSRKMYFNEQGIELNKWKEILENGNNINLEEFTDTIINKNLRNSVFVDVTASEEVAGLYEKLLAKSISVVACNKVAASSDYSNYKKLKDLANEFSALFLFETNVGAGLPVIGTLNDLVRSGDEVNRIEAVLSGTLNFVFNNYDGKKPFAEIVRQAQDEGYTEPDPRLDLSGKDVMRKIMILAREAGAKLQMEDISNNSFMPDSCMQGSVDDFYKAMAKEELHFKKLYDAAMSEGKKLKFVAKYENGKASVGLQHIDLSHDFYHLYGKDNIVLFYTNRYIDQPLVVKGAGAGAEVTASGVFADIIRAARI